MTVQIKVKKLFPDAQLPTQKYNTDVGYDIYVYSVEDCGNYLKINTGISVQPEVGYNLELVPRSSAHKEGLVLYNSLGILEQTYTGPIIGILYKTKDYLKVPKKGDRLLQLIVRKQFSAEFVEVEDLALTARGSGGLGSTGKSHYTATELGLEPTNEQSYKSF